jgi:Ca2+-binding RTX toxin-like protein
VQLGTSCLPGTTSRLAGTSVQAFFVINARLIPGGTGYDTLLGNALANRLTGGNGNNILVGLEAGDILEAGSGRDILIGSLGADILSGGAGEDILIAGRTTSDTSLANLFVLRSHWS